MSGPHDRHSYFEWGAPLPAEDGALIYVTCPHVMIGPKSAVAEHLKDWVRNAAAPTLLLWPSFGGKRFVWVYWPDPGCEL